MSEAGDRQRIAELLSAFDATLREKAGCYLGGGAALVLALGEYRQLNNVNFMCASAEGYRLLRNTVQDALLGALLERPQHLPRRAGCPDQGGFRVGDPGCHLRHLRRCPPHPMLSRVDMYAEKLLANADRGLDRSTGSRDIIDLAMVIRNGGPIPRMSWQKARQAYGDYAVRAFDDARDLIRDRRYRRTR
jgi:hypothetical protein